MRTVRAVVYPGLCFPRQSPALYLLEENNSYPDLTIIQKITPKFILQLPKLFFINGNWNGRIYKIFILKKWTRHTIIIVPQQIFQGKYTLMVAMYLMHKPFLFILLLLLLLLFFLSFSLVRFGFYIFEVYMSMYVMCTCV